MPVYEYQCQDCGHQFEAEQRISEPKLKDCPECKKPQLERLISATSFQLKGGGWYRDGYGDKKSKSTDNDRGDRLGKAIEKDKKKSEAASESSSAAESAPAASSGDGGGGGGASSGSEKSQAA